MSTMSKTLLAVLVGILVGGATYVMAATPSDKSSSPTTTPAAATTSTTGNVDVSGPCDEAEHANDPRCAGPQRPEDNGNDDNQAVNGQTTTTDDGPGHDVGDDNPGEHSNRGLGSQNSGRGSSHSDDGPNHDVGDDHGGHGADDGPTHDAGDDHGGDSGNSGSDHSGGSDD